MGGVPPAPAASGHEGLSKEANLDAFRGLCGDPLTGALLAVGGAFGPAAVLSLLTGDLLAEAHTSDTPFATATVSAGFLARLLLEMAL